MHSDEDKASASYERAVGVLRRASIRTRSGPVEPKRESEPTTEVAKSWLFRWPGQEKREKKAQDAAAPTSSRG